MNEPASGGTDERSVVSVRRMEAVVAAVLFVMGAVFLYQSYKLGFRWAVEGPESGFFPFYVSLIICGASATVLFGALRRRGGEDQSFVGHGQLKQVLSVLVPAAIYVLGIQLIGIYVASAIYISLFMRMLGKYSWLKSIALGVAICLIFFVMFEVWFQVPLYKGEWNLTGWTGY